MTLRFLDLTALFRFIASDMKATGNEQHGVRHNKTWYQHLTFMSVRAKQRRQLLNLSDEQLDDIGITRAEALEEANKPFWQA